MKKDEIIEQISADVKIFLKAHPHSEFYALAFDCNTEYAEFLVCMNTQAAFLETLRQYREKDGAYRTNETVIRELRYNPGDWDDTDISEIELFSEEELAEKYGNDLEKQCAEILQLCEELLCAFCRTETFKSIPKTQDFIAFCIDHDEDPEDALARVDLGRRKDRGETRSHS